MGRRVRELRRMRHLSQRELATIYGCPRSYISKVENNKAQPFIASLLRFAEVLRVPVVVLVEPDDTMVWLYLSIGQMTEADRSALIAWISTRTPKEGVQ